jgi:hypothetical protein
MPGWHWITLLFHVVAQPSLSDDPTEPEHGPTEPLVTKRCSLVRDKFVSPRSAELTGPWSEPVVLGRRVFVAPQAEGQVTATDLETGFTEGIETATLADTVVTTTHEWTGFGWSACVVMTFPDGAPRVVCSPGASGAVLVADPERWTISGLQVCEGSCGVRATVALGLRLYALPWSGANEILAVDLEHNRFRGLPLSAVHRDSSEGWKSAVLFGTKVYAPPCRANSTLELDTRHWGIEELRGIRIVGLDVPDDGLCKWGAASLFGSILYAAPETSGSVLALHLRNCTDTCLGEYMTIPLFESPGISRINEALLLINGSKITVLDIVTGRWSMGRRTTRAPTTWWSSRGGVRSYSC